MTPRIGIALALIAVAVARTAHAAHAPADSARRVVFQDTVTVQASRLHLTLRELATTATVVTPEQVRLTGARGVAATVAGVPGVHVYDLTGSETDPQVEARGFASLGFTSHVRVLVDEMPVNDLEGSRVDWNLVAPGQVDHVELLRGPASYLYGDAAMAGVIDIVTRGALAGWRTWGTLEGGDRDERLGDGGVAWRDGSRSFGATASYRDLDGWRQHSAAALVSGTLTGGLALGSRWAARGNLLLHREDAEEPGALPDPLWHTDPRRAFVPVLGDSMPPDFRRVHDAEGNLELRGALGRAGVVAGLGDAARALDARETIIPAGTLDRVSNAHRQRAELRVDWPLPHDVQLVLGAEGEHGRLRGAYFPADDTPARDAVGAADVVRDAFGAFALARARLGARLSLTAAVRGDALHSHVEGTSGTNRLSAFSPALALNRASAKGGNAFVSAGGSFKAPTLEQLDDPRPYFVPDGSGGFVPVTISSGTLQPQRGWNVDAGVRALPTGRAHANATFYYGRSRDEIGFDLANFRYSNIARSIHYGFEGDIQTALPKGFDASVGYAYTRAVFDGGDNDTKQINGVPEHQLTARIMLTLRTSGQLACDLRYFDRQWIDEANTLALPAYGVSDVTVRQPIGPLAITAAVRNVFDRRYAGAGYVTSDFSGNPLPLYYPGPGRAFRAGLQWQPGR